MQLNVISFDCDRTCPLHEEKKGGLYLCRFNDLFKALGISTVVHSHTALAKVDYTDIDALRKCVQGMGGIWYGQGHYSLGDTQQDGWGFRLPMAKGFHEDKNYPNQKFWYHPIVLRGDGQLAFDAYGGNWGDMKTLDQLRGKYMEETGFSQKVEEQAKLLGYAYERTSSNELVVYHPSGGKLTLAPDGKIATDGFHGGGCHNFRQELGLEAEGIVETGEACQVASAVNQGE
jgi:hypothetical protein